jgi:hypothetical protein
VDLAAERNMYLALNTGWYRDVQRGVVSDLYKRGYELGNRYKDKNNIIWLTAGEAGGHKRKGRTVPDEKLQALVRGIRDGDTGNKLLTIHADYKRGTSLDNDTRIVDFDNWQTSQWCCPNDLPREYERNWTVWEAITYDYTRKPVKPTLDSEAWYERNKSHRGTMNHRLRSRFGTVAGEWKGVGRSTARSSLITISAVQTVRDSVRSADDRGIKSLQLCTPTIPTIRF